MNDFITHDNINEKGTYNFNLSLTDIGIKAMNDGNKIAIVSKDTEVNFSNSTIRQMEDYIAKIREFGPNLMNIPRLRNIITEFFLLKNHRITIL